jgi:NHL repeat
LFVLFPFVAANRRQECLRHLALVPIVLAFLAPVALHTQTLSFAGVQSTVASRLDGPEGVAVDGKDDLFIVEAGNGIVVEVPDSAGDVFVADTHNNRVLEVPAGCTSATCQTTVGSALINPVSVAVDGKGDVFIGEDLGQVVEVSSIGVQTTVASGLSFPVGIATDSAGDVFIAASGSGQVVEVQHTSVNFGNINVGAASQVLTLTYNVTASDTLGTTPSVLTQGAPKLDFSLASDGTCTGAVTAGSQCTVNATFAPKAPGLRMGAVQITDSSGNVLATTSPHGIGQGPAIAYGPGTQTTIPASGLNEPFAVAVDRAGDVFVADNRNARVVKVSPSGPQTITPAGRLYPQGVAVDGAGDVFIADAGNNRVLEVPWTIAAAS